MSLESSIGSSQDMHPAGLAWPDWPDLLKIDNKPCSVASLAAKACPSSCPSSWKKWFFPKVLVSYNSTKEFSLTSIKMESQNT